MGWFNDPTPCTFTGTLSLTWTCPACDRTNSTAVDVNQTNPIPCQHCPSALANYSPPRFNVDYRL